MLEIKSNEGKVDIINIQGTTNEIVKDIGAIIHEILLTIANNGAKSKEEIMLRYGMLARVLVEYIDSTVKGVDEIGK